MPNPPNFRTARPVSPHRDVVLTAGEAHGPDNRHPAKTTRHLEKTTRHLENPKRHLGQTTRHFVFSVKEAVTAIIPFRLALFVDNAVPPRPPDAPRADKKTGNNASHDALLPHRTYIEMKKLSCRGCCAPASGVDVLSSPECVAKVRCGFCICKS